MLNGGRAKFFANGAQHRFAFGAFVIRYFDLDQFVRLDRGGNFLQHGLAQTAVTDEHQRF